MAKTLAKKGVAAVQIVFYGIIALALSSCGTVTPRPITLSPAVVASQTTIDEKAWYAAEALYNVPAQAYVAADSRGLMPAATKAIVKPILVKMNGYRVAARTAYRVGNTTAFNFNVGQLVVLREQVGKLIPGL